MIPGAAPRRTGSVSNAPVRVMLCDDSVTVRSAFARVLEADPAIQVVARAGDGQQALAAFAALPVTAKPQVVLLDLEMPVMDGMTALPLLLQQRPRPAVIVASALTQRGAAAAMAALRAGAADYIPKPGAAGGGLNDPTFRAELLAKVKGWARMGGGGQKAAIAPAAAPPPRRVAPPRMGGAPRAIGIGSSTGGPQALASLVKNLKAPLPVPVLVVQHMPAGFTTMLADHLNRLGGPPCSEAQDGEIAKPGRIYVAPGNFHMLAQPGQSGGLVLRLSDSPPENFCRPAVDPMLRSLVAASGGPVMAVILTGMGQDGLLGCRAVADGGGIVFAQDEASSVVWGMPGAVARAGLAQAQLPPEALANEIMAACGGVRGRAA